MNKDLASRAGLFRRRLPIVTHPNDKTLKSEAGAAQANARRFAVFSGVGVINTGVDFAVFASLAALSVHLGVANVVAFLIANIGSYVLNARVTFADVGNNGGEDAGRKARARYLKFLAGHGVSLAVSTVIVMALAISVGALAAKLVAVLFSLVWNYLFCALFVFRKAQSQTNTPAESP